MKLSNLALLCLLAGLFVLTSCSGTGSLGNKTESASVTLDRATSYEEAPPATPSPAYAGEAGGASTAEIQAYPKKIIKNATLSFWVQEPEKTIPEIQKIAAEAKGFVSSANVNELENGAKSGYVVVRIPSNKFETVLAELKKLAVRVESEQISSTDVTEEFVDTESRLRNLKATEEQYLKIMKSANKVEDVLKVAEKLSEVRGQIESTQGRLNYLSRQVDMSTITINLSSDKQLTKPIHNFSKAFHDLFKGIGDYMNAIVYGVVILPVYILWGGTVALVLFLLWKGLKALPIWKSRRATKQQQDKENS